MPGKDPVSKKSKKKIRHLEKALKAARRNEYGPAMITKSGHPRCPNPGCRKAASYSGQRFCTRCCQRFPKTDPLGFREI